MHAVVICENDCVSMNDIKHFFFSLHVGIGFSLFALLRLRQIHYTLTKNCCPKKSLLTVIYVENGKKTTWSCACRVKYERNEEE